jgi:hypothetical protein
MDAFNHIALVFEKDCIKRLKALENAQFIMEFSDSVASALRLIFIQSEIYADDYEHLRAILPEIARLRNCIDSRHVWRLNLAVRADLLIEGFLLFSQEILDHAWRLYALNFNTGVEKEVVFNKEICYSYACKMLNSTGPRKQHFSGSPTSSQIVNAELRLALHSPYVFGSAEEDLFCYETMEYVEEGEERFSYDEPIPVFDSSDDEDLLCYEPME